MILARERKLIVTGALIERRSHFQQEVDREVARIQALVSQCQLVDSDLLRELDGYRRIQARIFFHLPDHHDILQEFIWVNQDRPPRFLALHRLLDHWQRNLDGKVHSVALDSGDPISQRYVPGWRAPKRSRKKVLAPSAKH